VGGVLRLVVNGVERTVDTDPDTPLIHVLRADLGLHGVRPGCAIGECGACVVLAGDRPVRSCQTPLSAVADAAVTTPEGLDDAVRQAFVDEQAAQCGYCVNGIMM
jgi:aerobic-type carbon monoxide dehydrogenase small subunit (CoxS/CutS family)